MLRVIERHTHIAISGFFQSQRCSYQRIYPSGMISVKNECIRLNRSYSIMMNRGDIYESSCLLIYLSTFFSSRKDLNFWHKFPILRMEILE